MALKTRIGRRESRAAHTPTPPCRLCGVPAGYEPIFEVVGADGAGVMDGCPECGHPLDEGRAVFALPPGCGTKQLGPDVDWRAV